MKTLRRTIHPEVRILNEQDGTVDYIASDETLDASNEVIMAGGWRFDDFQKNSPFVDSHDYSTVENCLGKVIDYRIESGRLINTVKWAIDVPDNRLARLGFAMTKGGYLKAVSVGFIAERYATKWDSDKTAWNAALKQLNLHEEDGVSCIFLQQQQKELSACIIGCNPNALAKSYKAGVITDADLETLSTMQAKRETASMTDDPADVIAARQRARTAFLMELHMQSIRNL